MGECACKDQVIPSSASCLGDVGQCQPGNCNYICQAAYISGGALCRGGMWTCVDAMIIGDAVCEGGYQTCARAYIAGNAICLGKNTIPGGQYGSYVCNGATIVGNAV